MTSVDIVVLTLQP